METLQDKMAQLALEAQDLDLPTVKEEYVIGENGAVETARGSKSSAYEDKILGNFAYTQRNFDKALGHYKNALAQDPNDMIYFLNIGAVYFEQKKFEECIDNVRKAIEVGRVNNAEKRLIAKAYCRIGRAFYQMGRFEFAKENCEKSLEENESEEASQLLKNIEKKLKQLNRRAYIDPMKAEEENELGSKLFEDQNYPEALKHFTEAVRCNPNNPKLLINRAACLAKMGKHNEALKLAEKVIDLDDQLITGFIIKGQILQKMERKTEACEAFKMALELDPKNSIALFGHQENSPIGNVILEKQGEREMSSMDVESERDETQPKQQEESHLDLMEDPEMLDIFHKVYEDPDSVALHLADPKVAANVRKMFFGGK